MNIDGSSQVDFCILISNKFDRFANVQLSNGKFILNTLSAETSAFVELFDPAFVLKHSLEKILERRIRFQMLTDSKQLFDAVSHSTQTEKHLLIDIAASTLSFEKLEISDLGLVAGRDMLAGCFTKVMELFEN
jgi:hypothetical protein